MITFFALSGQKSEYELIKASVSKHAALCTEEKWEYIYVQTLKEAEGFFRKEPVLDFISWDVTLKGAKEALGRIRKGNGTAFLLIVADATVSPLHYLKPGISPDALLLKPIDGYSAETIVREIFEVFMKRMESGEEYSFLVETRGGKQYVPFGQIDCFEAKEKKVFVRTKSREYGFYDTLDELMERLPDGFLRCHRSYIVNMKRAEKLLLSENFVRMADGVMVPFSRSYKKALKGYWKDE